MNLGIFFTALGYLIGGLVFYLVARQRKVATEGFGYILVAGFCGGIVGAKLTEWLLNGPSFLANHIQAFINPSSGGRALMGGILFGWISVEIAKHRLGIHRSTGDLFALALPSGEMIGRIGCFFNTCCYGLPSTLPWAVYQHGEWRHPAQLYSSLGAGIILLLLLSVRKRMTKEGDLFKTYIVFYSVSRFIIEFSRERTVVFLNLSLAQWICFVAFCYFGFFLYFNRHSYASLVKRTA